MAAPARGKGALSHWGRVTHISVVNLTIIGLDNGLSPGRRQAIIWTNDGILLIGPLGTNCSEILSKMHTFWSKKMHLKTSSAKWRPFCLGLNVLKLSSGNSSCDRYPTAIIVTLYTVIRRAICDRIKPCHIFCLYIETLITNNGTINTLL